MSYLLAFVALVQLIVLVDLWRIRRAYYEAREAAGKRFHELGKAMGILKRETDWRDEQPGAGYGSHLNGGG